MRRVVTIKSFNGIGDLLFVTPTLRVIKEQYKDAVRITVNTNYPALLRASPFVDRVSAVDKDGVFLQYPDPIHLKMPKQHHVLTDWEVVCREYGLKTEKPKIRPEVFLRLPCRNGRIGVQTIFSTKYGGKKMWLHATELVNRTGWEAIGHIRNVVELVEKIAGYSMIVCAEGGVHHIAAATGTPAVVIFGGFVHPDWTGYPWQKNLMNRLPCSGDCYNHHACKNEEEHKCWDRISVNDVIETVEEGISNAA